MGMTPPVISNVNFSLVVSEYSHDSLDETIRMKLPISFTDAAHVYRFMGSYTPNNDYLYLFSGYTLTNAPNFMIAICDSATPMSLSCQFQKSNLNIQVQRFSLFSWVMDPLNFCVGCFIDGRLQPNPGNTPLVQGQAINYELIIGQATIS